jgi:hypothetical protein
MIIRTIFGFAFAPLIPVFIVFLFDRPAASVIALFGYLTALFLGVPTHFLLRKFERFSWLSYAIAGFVVGILGGAAAGVFLIMPNHMPPGTSIIELIFDAVIAPFQDPLPFAFLGCLGTVGALAFWLIARPDARHNPRDHGASTLL